MNVTGRLVSAAALVVGLAAATTAPAFAVDARTLPAGDTYYAMPCVFSGNFPSHNLNTVASDGSTSSVGATEFEENFCLADGSFNVVDGFYYAYDWAEQEYNKVNIETGAVQSLGDLTLDDVSFTDVEGTFVDSAGNHYLLNDVEVDDEVWQYGLYSIDITDLSLTLIEDDLAVGGTISSIAFNSVDSKYYALQNDGPGHIWEIDLTDGSVLDKGQIDICDGGTDCWGLDFDSTGNLWIQQDGANVDDDDISTLYSTSLSDLNGALVEQGVFTDSDSGDWYSESTFIVHSDAELADTGYDPMVPAGIAGAVAVAGSILMMRRRSA